MKAKGSAFITFALAGALAGSAAPAFAQHHRDGGNGGGEQRHENAAPRNQPRAERPQQQAQPRNEERAQPRAQRAPEQRAVPREQNRQENRAQAAPRYEQRAQPRYENRRSDGRYYSSGRYYGPRYSGPRFSIAPRRFYRPYYVFRPRLSLGFGIWAGFPVTYYDPYYYPYNNNYYPGNGGTVYVNPGANTNPNQSNMGGVSFDITPDEAEVWVDGNYMGQVADYTASSQPLGLAAGRHHIELREPGYQASSFDVDVIPGQVIPFQGTLQ